MSCLFESVCEPMPIIQLCECFVEEVSKINLNEVHDYSEYLEALKQGRALEKAYLYRAELFNRMVFDKDSFLETFEEYSEGVTCIDCSCELDDESYCYPGLCYEKPRFLCSECFLGKGAIPKDSGFVFGCRLWLPLEKEMVETALMKLYNKMVEMLEKDCDAIKKRMTSIKKTRDLAKRLAS